MKNILLLVHDDDGQESRFQAALDITRAVNGHLICLDVSIVPMVIEDYVPAGGAALLLADEQQREHANRKSLEARLANEGVNYNWIDVTGELAPALRDAAVLADVIVVNRQLGGLHYPDMRAVAGDLVVSTETPVIAVPEDARGFAVAGRAMVAWNGSREAGEALEAAIPLLALASSVTIVAVDDGSIRVPGSDAAAYLSRHGIEPVIRSIATSQETVGEVLLAQARDLRADWLVMGGYGRSRLVEAIAGGVTRRMLTESPVPLFLAH